MQPEAIELAQNRPSRRTL